MSIPIRKAVRDALVTILSDATNGFNAKLAALEVAYGITGFTIDWSPLSTNFAQVQLDPEQAEMFHAFTQWPACMVFTTEAINLPGEGVKYQTFSGQVIANVEFLLRHRAIKDGDTSFADTNNMESMPDAVEDAVFDSIHTQRASLNVPGFHWNRRFSSGRDPVRILGDGHFQRVFMALDIERHI